MATYSVPTVDYIPIEFKAWTGGRTVEHVGTNAGLAALAFQRWRSFKEAFAPEIIERAISETPGKVTHIADPFGGSGTTGLSAQFLGVKPTLIEVNPYLADLIDAKLALYDFEELSIEFQRVCVLAASLSRESPRPSNKHAPATFVEPGVNGQFIFSKDVANRIACYRFAIDNTRSTCIRRLLKVLLGSILVQVSNVVISGKGRRYRNNWRSRRIDPIMVDELFVEYVANAMYDLRRFSLRACRDYTLLRGDSRSLCSNLGEIDLAVFSPPYPNSFDYTDVYNVELWALGYLNTPSENRALREATVRSHVQISRDMGGTRFKSSALRLAARSLAEARSSLWNKNIPEMIGAYVSDMGQIMGLLSQQLRAKGRVYMVVGDSRYAGVDVPVAQILCEIAKQTGLRVVKSEPSRSMRASPQQGGQAELFETLLIFAKGT